MTDKTIDPNDISHALASTYDAPTLAHALAARLAIDGKPELGAKAAALGAEIAGEADGLLPRPPSPG